MWRTRLIEAGAVDGDTVHIGPVSFEFESHLAPDVEVGVEEEAGDELSGRSSSRSAARRSPGRTVGSTASYPRRPDRARSSRLRDDGDRCRRRDDAARSPPVSRRLDRPVAPTDMPTLQATAAVGQVRLIEAYADACDAQGAQVGQVLVTRHDVGHRQQYVNACQTLERLLDLGVVPIVNENDTTAVEEIRFGDNDYLAALVGMMVHADLVVLLTDIEGLYTADPRQDCGAPTSSSAWIELTDEHLAAAGGAGSAWAAAAWRPSSRPHARS